MKRLVAIIAVLVCTGSAVVHSADGANNSGGGQVPSDAMSHQGNSSERSGAHSSLDWSASTLAMVRLSAPNIPLYSWDAGTLECPQTDISEVFYLKNFGTEAINITSTPELSDGADFSRLTTCPCVRVLAPGQMDACSLTIVFYPLSEGVFLDTMRIESNAWNSYGGFVRFSLSGTRVSTPLAPQVVVKSQGDDVHVYWSPVTQSIYGCAISPSEYRLYSASDVNGPYVFQASTPGTSYVLPGMIQGNSRLYYLVTARTQ